MKLFDFHYNGMLFELIGSSWSGLEQLLIDGKEVSRKRNFRFSGSHSFSIPDLGTLNLNFTIDKLCKNVCYQLQCDNVVLVEETKNLRATKQTKSLAVESGTEGNDEPSPNPARGRKSNSGHFVSWLGLGFKLFKSAKVLKVALAGAAFSGWSIIFSWEFALVLISVIVFHEYGHLRAMKKFNIPTKGMYLIPFFGGVAVGDKPKTQWQDVYISMMGPVYGLAMSIVFYLIYLFSGNHFAGLVASISALVNVINLLPVYPLDGGRVLKALVFSGRKYWGLVLLLATSAALFAVSAKYGLVLLSFFIVIGVIDLIASWRDFSREGKTPLNPYGIAFSLVWYLLTIAVFLVVIYSIAASGLPGSELATMFLES
ncbi:site-2 protease family protein [Motiliproteus sp. MSK22-1]|uniref:site-2 protease family protein n=1 Tax=Motiliproteus sp. MSK22-1 TaxID=1897630 RepID=UPI000976BAA6|nr:site-2 protease family protein [Motiliproteus sp. MSK22-1]OMH25785.1 hypothetical protein BGP75_25000 [Motiliproteus sp. MSK22-1]